MTRLVLFAVAALFATSAHAQNADLEAEIERRAANAEEEGWAVVAGPAVVADGADVVPIEVDLEAGEMYFVKVFARDGSGLDPDIWVDGPYEGRIAVANESLSTEEELMVMPDETGTHRVNVPMSGMGCRGRSDAGCAYAYMVIRL